MRPPINPKWNQIQQKVNWFVSPFECEEGYKWSNSIPTETSKVKGIKNKVQEFLLSRLRTDSCNCRFKGDVNEAKVKLQDKSAKYLRRKGGSTEWFRDRDRRRKKGKKKHRLTSKSKNEHKKCSKSKFVGIALRMESWKEM